MIDATEANDFLVVDEEDDFQVPLKQNFLKGRLQAEERLARLMLWEACPKALRLRIAARKPVVVIIEPPGDDWFNAVLAAAQAFVRPSQYLICESGKKSKGDLFQDSALRTAVATAQSLVVVGREGLSHAIQASADFNVKVSRPSGKLIALTIKETFGNTRVQPLPKEFGAELDASVVLGAIRRGESAARAISRLSALDSQSRLRKGAMAGPRLEDLGGYGDAKDWGFNLATDIAAYREGSLNWESVSSAAVLFGEPGTGKTYFAAALARTCGIPLVVTGLGEIFNQCNGYLEGVVKALSAAFNEAAEKSPAILFFDELDSIPDRRSLEPRAREWWTTIVNHVLKLIDNRADGVVLLGATNLVDRLDSALIRPGRLERQFEIVPPSVEELEKVFRLHLGDDLVAEDLKRVAQLAIGFSGARVAMIVKGALACARRRGRALTVDDLAEELADDLAPDLLERICIHEAGHAVAAIALGRTVDHVSIMGKSGKLPGVLVEGPGEGATRRSLDNHVVMLLAGRRAEILLLGEASAGAQLDLRAATRLVAATHFSLGLGEQLTYLGDIADTESLLIDRGAAKAVEAALQELDRRCQKLLEPRQPQIRSVADRLREARVLSGDALRQLVTP